MPIYPEPDLDNRAKNIEYDVVDGCWVVTSHRTDSSNYIPITRNSERDLIHRYVKSKEEGRSIPDGKVVMHTCDNKECINPDHLKIATQKENMQDAYSKGIIDIMTRPTGSYDKSGENNPSNKLSEEEVIEIYQDDRTQKLIAEDYEVSRSLVSHIKNQRIWTEVTKDIKI